jgi:hypothetical protein
MVNLKPPGKVNNRNKGEDITKKILAREQCHERENGDIAMAFGLRMLHHNVQSLSNKKNEIAMMLAVDRKHIKLLCLTEHWLREEQLNVINFDHLRWLVVIVEPHVHWETRVFM